MALQREQVVQSAEKYVSRGKIEPAIREYRKLLAENPNDINTLNRVGDLYARIQRIDEAVDFFTQIGEQYTTEGFFVKAIAIYKKIIKLDPTRLDVYERLADLYHKQNLVNEARTQYQVLADYYTKHDNAPSAIAIYNKMTDLEPENPSYHVKLAEIYQQQKLFEKAINEYRVIAELMIRHGRTQEAAQVYERALGIDAANLRFIRSAAEALRDAGADAAAAHFLSVAVERNPEAEGIVEALSRRRPPEPEAEPEPEIELEAEPEPEHGRTRLDDASIELEIDMGDDLMAAMRAAEAAVSGEPSEAATIAEPESEELEFDLGPLEELVVELPDEDEAPASLVQPPPDMAGAPVRPPWARHDDAPAFMVEADEIALQPLEMEELALEPAPPSHMPLEAFAEADAFVLDTLDADIEMEALPDVGDAFVVDPLAADSGSETRSIPGLAAWREEVAAPSGQSQVFREDERDELINEAEVLAKYGLEDKAVERLEEAIRLRPNSLAAHALLIRLHLAKGRHEQVVPLARSLAGLALDVGAAEPWQTARASLVEAGYALDGDVVVSAPHAPAPAPAEPVEEALPSIEEHEEHEEIEEDIPFEELPSLKDLTPLEEMARMPEPLVEEIEPVEEAEPIPPAPPVEEAPSRPAAKVKDMDDLIRGILSDAPPTPARKPAPLPPAPAPAPPSPASPPVPPPALAQGGLFDLTSLGGMIEAEEMGQEMQPFPSSIPSEPPPSPAPPPSGSALLDETGMSWLDEAETSKGRPEQAAAGGSALFDEEDDFFDLAGELVEELSREEVFQDGVMVQAEQSLEEIVEGFKKGVAEHLSPTDYATHYNLGIAYREMGLLDEAIGEFQLAAKEESHLVVCCSMLGLCFLDKGLPELAIKWYRRGLESHDLGEEDQLGLMYDMGNAFMAMGDMATAFSTFVELYGINTNYRDVVAKIEELRK